MRPVSQAVVANNFLAKYGQGTIKLLVPFLWLMRKAWAEIAVLSP
jgi:hypothetical protein